MTEVQGGLWVLTVETDEGVIVHVEGAKFELEKMIDSLEKVEGEEHPHLTQMPMGWTCNLPGHEIWRRKPLDES